MIDQHVHTSLCRHATGRIEEYVEGARRSGVTTMTFTDHLPLPQGYPGGYTMLPEELALYVADVRAAAHDALAAGGPEVLCGIEADWIPEAARLVPEAVSAFRFDVVLGSVHFIEDWAFDDPELIGRYDGLDIDDLWDRYFVELAAAARSGLFDVMAHPDLVKKFGFFPARRPDSLYERTAEVLAEAGVAVEVNTAGLRKPVGEMYPSLDLLRACASRGVPATVGSDAHAPDEVGRGLAQASDLLHAAGYESVVVFRDRRAEEVPLW